MSAGVHQVYGLLEDASALWHSQLMRECMWHEFMHYLKAVCLSNKMLIEPMFALGLHRQSCDFSGHAQSFNLLSVFQFPTTFCSPPVRQRASSDLFTVTLVLDSIGSQPTSAVYCWGLCFVFMILHCAEDASVLFAIMLTWLLSAIGFHQHSFRFTYDVCEFYRLLCQFKICTRGHFRARPKLGFSECVLKRPLQFVVHQQAHSDLFRRGYLDSCRSQPTSAEYCWGVALCFHDLALV